MTQLRATFLLLLICMVATYLPTTARKPPFNGSIFGKRYARDMDTDSRSSEDIRHPACEYVYESCNQWYLNGQDSQ